MKGLLLIIAVVVLMTGFLLGGCAEPEPEPAAPTTPTTPAEPAAPAEPAKPPAKAIILREGLIHNPQDQIGDETIKMAERFNARVDGYVLEAHCGGTLASMPETLDAVRTGTMELGQWPIGVFANADARFASAELPFLLNNVEANIEALYLLHEDYSAVCEEKFNQKVLGTFTATSLDLLSKKPVRTMADWDGLLVMAINPATAVTIETLGGSAVSLPWPDAYTSLDKGVVDAGMYATNQMVIYNLWEVADYLVPVYMVPTGMVDTINLDVWNSLPKDIQDILAEEHMKKGKILNDLWIELVEEHLVTLADVGLEVISLPESERNLWRDALAPFREESLAGMGDFGKRVQEVADQVNAQYPYQSYGK